MSVAYAEAALGVPTEGTGSTLYERSLLDSDEFAADQRRTHIVSTVSDPVLREVLDSFHETLVHRLSSVVARISSWSVQQQHTVSALYSSATFRGTIAPAAYWLPVNYSNFTQNIIVTAASTANYLISTGAPASLRVIEAETTASLLSDESRAILLPGLSQLYASSRDPLIPRTTVTPLAVTAVENIADWLGVPAADVLRATGIVKRTYQEWKKTGTRRPRASSEGRLWELHQLAADLVETMGRAGVRTWLSQDPARRKLLRSGAIDQVASQAYAAQASTTPRPSWVGVGSPEEHLAPRRNVKLGKMDPGDVVEPEK